MGNSPDIDEAAIRAVAALLHEADLHEIEIVQGDAKLRVVRGGAHAPGPQAVATPIVQEPTRTSGAGTTAPSRRVEGAVLSPMVGTAYRAPEPGAKPFVDVGDAVRAGQVVMIVEAMKTMNQISAEADGTVDEIYVQDGQPVEYGEPLLAIR